MTRGYSMKYFLIKQILEEQKNGEGISLSDHWPEEKGEPFVIILSKQEWGLYKEKLDMGIELEPDTDADLNKAHLEHRQNHIMTILTVVTTIFMPLTLITGWYGMNFRYMPELETRWGYPIVFGICILIIIGSLVFLKKKKWL